MSEKEAKKRIVERMFTVVSKLEKIESFARAHNIETPHGVQNMIQVWYEWVSQRQSD